MSEKKQEKQKRASREPMLRDSSPMDVELLKQLVDLMAANDLSALDLRDGNRRVALKRGQALVAPPITSGGTPPVVSAAAREGPPATPPPADPNAGLIPIKSPMVGTFYLAPAPDAPPFAPVGTVVNENTEVCTIEAMKVYNNIKAECRGTIEKVVAENGKPVEFGQVLFLVRP